MKQPARLLGAILLAASGAGLSAELLLRLWGHPMPIGAGFEVLQAVIFAGVLLLGWLLLRGRSAGLRWARVLLVAQIVTWSSGTRAYHVVVGPMFGPTLWPDKTSLSISVQATALVGAPSVTSERYISLNLVPLFLLWLLRPRPAQEGQVPPAGLQDASESRAKTG